MREGSIGRSAMKSTRRVWCGLMSAVLGVVGCAKQPALVKVGDGLRLEEKNAPRPNIVFIMTDDQRWDALSCAGSPVIKTPNIDRLASEGAMFQNYFVTLSLCSPSRACILTGQYAHKNGIINNSDH